MKPVDFFATALKTVWSYNESLGGLAILMVGAFYGLRLAFRWYSVAVNIQSDLAKMRSQIKKLTIRMKEQAREMTILSSNFAELRQEIQDRFPAAPQQK